MSWLFSQASVSGEVFEEMSWLISQALMEDYANSRSLRGLVAEFSAANCSDGEPSAQLNGNPTQQAYLSPDRMTEFSRLSRFGMTFAPLTESLGVELLTWYLAGFPAKPTAAHLEGKLWLTISGRKCGESWQMSLPGTYLPKTLIREQSTLRQMSLKRWVILSDASKFPRRTWVRTTFGQDAGYLHTPTTVANFCAPSMQKHPSCRMWSKVFGRVSPVAFEYLMGWPQDHTDLKPLGMDKFQQWWQQHGNC